MPSLPDLVRDSKLATRFLPDHVQHTYIETSQNRRRVLRQEKWKKERQIGQGAFGQVWLETCTAGKSSGRLRAVKKVQKHASDLKNIDYHRELEAVAKFSHRNYQPCFVESYGWYEDSEAIYIAMEYLACGDLHHYLARSPPLPVHEARELTLQILEGLSDMHLNGFAHRDLKPANILIKSQPPDHWWVKISDLGITKRAEQENGPSTVKGTLEYMAPELLGFGESSSTLDSESSQQAADMWALGEITFRMLTGERTFKDPRTLGEYCQGQIEFPTAKLIPCAGEHGAQFAQAIMAARPENRLGADDALQHPWINLTDGVNGPDLLVEPINVDHVGSSSTAPSLVDKLEPTLTVEPSAKWSDISREVSTVRMIGPTESNGDRPRDSSQPDELLTTVPRRTSLANIQRPNSQSQGAYSADYHGDSSKDISNTPVESPRAIKKYPPTPTVEDYESELEETIRLEVKERSFPSTPADIHSDNRAASPPIVIGDTSHSSSDESPPSQILLSSSGSKSKGKAVKVLRDREKSPDSRTYRPGSWSTSSGSDSWVSENPRYSPRITKTKSRRFPATESRPLHNPPTSHLSGSIGPQPYKRTPRNQILRDIRSTTEPQSSLPRTAGRQVLPLSSPIGQAFEEPIRPSNPLAKIVDPVYPKAHQYGIDTTDVYVRSFPQHTTVRDDVSVAGSDPEETRLRNLDLAAEQDSEEQIDPQDNVSVAGSDPEETRLRNLELAAENCLEQPRVSPALEIPIYSRTLQTAEVIQAAKKIQMINQVAEISRIDDFWQARADALQPTAAEPMYGSYSEVRPSRGRDHFNTYHNPERRFVLKREGKGKIVGP